MKPQPTVTAYLARLSPKARAAVKAARAVVLRANPDVEEVLSYGILGFKMRGRTGVFLAGWDDFISMYPVTAGVREVLGEQLKPFAAGKGTLRFPLAKKLPSALIAKVVKVRTAEVDALTAARARPKRR
ncbi:MAG: DUF1801 domain-containing protein [Myxococcaceae bacterium]